MTPKVFLDHVAATYKPAPMLFSLIPEGKLDWAPAPTMMTIRALIHHLSGRTGVSGLVTGDFDPAHCWGDSDDPASTTPETASTRLAKAIEETKKCLRDVSMFDWENKIVQMPWGSKGTLEIMAHALIIEHFLNHKMQLFLYLRLLGVPADTGTLYFGIPAGKMSGA
jgi:hypothetical protein